MEPIITTIIMQQSSFIRHIASMLPSKGNKQQYTNMTDVMHVFLLICF